MSKSNVIYPLEMESLSFTRDNGNESSSQQQEQQPSFQPLFFIQNLFALIAAYASYYSHITVPIAAICLVIVVILTLDFVAAASTSKHVAMVKHDYTAVLPYELKMQQIDHWCLSGGDDDCRCDDPTIPMSNEQTKGWVKAHKYNKMLLEPPSSLSNIDVVMLGDQSIEEWNARLRGTPNDDYKGAKTYFETKFKRASAGDVEGVALGVAGDSISNLLWRLQHGEMPNALAPPVWWVLIGANDLSVGQCSEEAVVLGILCLAEYIAAQRPGSTVVINSILPALTTVKPSVKTAHFKTFDLFPSIRVVNEQLERFCKNHTNFRFFDATPLFFDGAIPPSTDKSKRKKSMPSLKTSLVSDDGQLTVAGHKVWADAMVMELKKLLYSDNDLGHISGPTDDMFSGDDYLVGGDDYRN